MNIRLENNSDHRAVENLNREAFWNVYRPGCLEHFLIHCLRDDPAFVPELDLVMEENGVLIGHSACMRSHICCDDGSSLPSLTLGPICIAPEHQRRGLGKKLLDETLRRAKAMGFGVVCLEGNIDFYGKSGFVQADTLGLRYEGMPDGKSAPFFLCCELKPGYLAGITGVYGPPAGYLVDENAAEVFDVSFPPREKLHLSTQIF